jgi:C1A family cysteine protease
MLKRLFLMALATMSISMTTGCGRTAMPMAADLGAQRLSAHTHTVFAAGKPRKLGFDMNRYLLKQAPMAHPQTLPPVQGMAPSKVDLREKCSPVYDQEDLGSCTAFAVAKGMREYLQVKHGERQAPLSALYQYYETRKIRGSVDQDSGATITDAIKAASAGVAPEQAWPYDTLQFDKQPPAAAYKAAGEFKLAKSVQLAGLEDIKKVLAKGQPVVFGMKIYSYFQNIGPSGELKLPQEGDVFVGGHAVCVVGYDNKKKVLIVRNSFGSEWGDHGYFYMPYAYVTPENVMDIWTAQ